MGAFLFFFWDGFSTGGTAATHEIVGSLTVCPRYIGTLRVEPQYVGLLEVAPQHTGTLRVN